MAMHDFCSLQSFSQGKTSTEPSGCLAERDSCRTSWKILNFFFLIASSGLSFTQILVVHVCQGREQKWNKIESQVSEITCLRIFTMTQSETESQSLQLSAVQKGLYDHLIFLIVSFFCLDLRELFSPL